MSQSLDPVISARQLAKEKTFDWPLLLASLIIMGFSLFIYHWEAQFEFTDLWVHARIAGEFDFSDLHSITSRVAYPMWHLCTAVVNKLGVPLVWASALVCALAKTAGMFLVRKLLQVISGVSRNACTVAAFLLMFVTGICLPWFNPTVYGKVGGSPTVWHNPTQLMVVVSMLLCVPFIAHCWYEFERRLATDGEKARLPWTKVIVLALLLMFSLACKPTFMQALIPACGVFFLVQWIRHPKNSRYFFQIILAFVPAVAYFLLQYLYYTGVVVPYTSGVEFGVTLESAWVAMRSMLIMAAFPLLAMVCCYKKGMLKDKMLVLTLLMIGFSLLEAMFFRETGLRWGHGNFNWASMTSALMLWVIMTGQFMKSFGLFLKSGTRAWQRWVLYGAGIVLFVWHIGSGGYYISYLLTSGNAF